MYCYLQSHREKLYVVGIQLEGNCKTDVPGVVTVSDLYCFEDHLRKGVTFPEHNFIMNTKDFIFDSFKTVSIIL